MRRNGISNTTLLFVIAFIMVLSIVVATLLAYDARPTEQTKKLIEICTTTWTMGFAAILALLGSKGQR
jgi:hypothetical protein